MNRIKVLMGLLMLAMTVTAWAAHEHASDMTDESVVGRALAKITATDPAGALTGEVRFEQKNGGLQVDAEVFNVPGPGEHGFHIHENGSCDDMGKAAGGHFNPLGVQHGFLPKDGMTAAHMGDMGSITIDDKGHGRLSIFLPGLSLLIGTHTVHDRAVILHEKADDFSQPTGNAGGRIGCGIIKMQ